MAADSRVSQDELYMDSVPYENEPRPGLLEHFNKLSVDSVKERCDSAYSSGSLLSDGSDGRFLTSDLVELTPICETSDHKNADDFENVLDTRINSSDSGACLSGTSLHSSQFRSINENVIPEDSGVCLSERGPTERRDGKCDKEHSDYTSLYGPPSNLTFNEEIVDQDDDGDTQIHLAIIQSLAHIVLNLIRQLPHHWYLNIQNKDRQTPLHLAVVTQQAVVVRSLICAGASLEYRDFNGNTPLHIAARNGNALVAALLLEPVQEEETLQNPYKIPYQKVPPNLEARNYDGQMSIHLAAERDHRNIIRLLLEKGADINARDGKSGRTILHYAAESRNLEFIQFLLRYEKLDINSVTYGGLTPVKLAHGRGFQDIVDLLQIAGASTCEDSSDEEDMEEDLNDVQIRGVLVSGR